MKPTEFANELRHIATAIERSENPKQSLVLQDLKRIAIMLEEVNVEPESEEAAENPAKGVEY